MPTKPMPDNSRIIDGVKNVSIVMPLIWSRSLTSDELAVNGREDKKSFNFLSEDDFKKKNNKKLTTKWNVTPLPSNGIVHCVAPRIRFFGVSVSAKIFGILHLWKHKWRLNVLVRILNVPLLASDSSLRYVHRSHIVSSVAHSAIICATNEKNHTQTS